MGPLQLVKNKSSDSATAVDSKGVKSVSTEMTKTIIDMENYNNAVGVKVDHL